MKTSFLYHSFPRRFKDDGVKEKEAALKVIANLCRFGFLLTPEVIEWNECLDDGTIGKPIKVVRRSLCLTELTPNELIGHCSEFGHYSVEFPISEIRKLGAMPVFYVPKADTSENLEGVGSTFVARICDIQTLLTRIRMALKNIENASPSERAAQRFGLTRAGKVIEELPCSGDTIGKFLNHIISDLRPYSELLGAVKGLGNLIFPTDDVKHGTPLGYYRLREWRVFGGLEKTGIRNDRKLTEEERAAVVGLESEWWERKLFYPTDEGTEEEEVFIDRCTVFPEVRGKHVLEFARRLIVPKEAIVETKRIINEAGLDISVTALDDVT